MSGSETGLVPGPSAASITTPTKRAAFAVSAEAGPSRARPAGASPAYSSRRHSLYGIEDRVVIDPGSRIWKVGFSGEPEPRFVFYALDEADSVDTLSTEAWDLDISRMRGVNGSRSEGDRLVGVRVIKKLRETFVRHLMTDPKARKIIILENTYLPIGVKEHIARALFDNLQVPSVSFTSSSLLALAACGRITGLVVDIGWLETTITPVYHSRPLYTLAQSTPSAGRRLHNHLRTLLHHCAIYIPPPSSLGDIDDRPRSPGVPQDILSDHFIETVLTEGCFVEKENLALEQDESMDVDTEEHSSPNLWEDGDSTRIAKEWKRRYENSSSAKAMSFRLSTKANLGPATIIVPGWIRERVAEILLNDEDGSEDRSVPTLILDCLLKLPIDLRSTFISSLLVAGGTASLPGFIPRIRVSLLHHLLPPPLSMNEPIRSPLNTLAGRKEETSLWRKRNQEPYQEIYGLASKLAIINDPAPLDGSEGFNGGKAPRWSTGLMSWVGGSLAGSLKTSSQEITRESYDTLVSISSSRGEIYKEELETSEVEVAATTGIDIEELKVGQALNDELGLGRRRGWKENAGLPDWSRAVKV
ncbi:uncharacterized protein IL334_006475 [Kwoniella shivajii]|uniref:Actin-related protein 10 n=1 Tax=Kwoniella shivajii TaxID=564305 RepID=A0ABZ1D633_9TREE|nr:hypothetical protein IL334_006475 [Kwoniella shivajii]